MGVRDWLQNKREEMQVNKRQKEELKQVKNEALKQAKIEGEEQRQQLFADQRRELYDVEKQRAIDKEVSKQKPLDTRTAKEKFVQGVEKIGEATKKIGTTLGTEAQQLGRDVTHLNPSKVTNISVLPKNEISQSTSEKPDFFKRPQFTPNLFKQRETNPNMPWAKKQTQQTISDTNNIESSTLQNGEPVNNIQQPVNNIQQPVNNIQQPVNNIQQPVFKKQFNMSSFIKKKEDTSGISRFLNKRQSNFDMSNIIKKRQNTFDMNKFSLRNKTFNSQSNNSNMKDRFSKDRLKSLLRK